MNYLKKYEQKILTVLHGGKGSYALYSGLKTKNCRFDLEVASFKNLKQRSYFSKSGRMFFIGKKGDAR
ncbi:MAG: hypothetical protein KatS3mg104_2945 [Phycisphaerae bacterium]|nr:MAG: hypothetical protein KatS3mg104_2945 [Phycisphaerae bacterium]